LFRHSGRWSKKFGQWRKLFVMPIKDEWHNGKAAQSPLRIKLIFDSKNLKTKDTSMLSTIKIFLGQ
jgi:hypothetical protein